MTNEMVEAEAGRASLREKALEKAALVKPSSGKLEIPDSEEESGESEADIPSLPPDPAQGGEHGETSLLLMDLTSSDVNEKVDDEDDGKEVDEERDEENEEDESPPVDSYSNGRRTSPTISVNDTESAEEDSDSNNTSNSDDISTSLGYIEETSSIYPRLGSARRKVRCYLTIIMC